MKRSYLKRFIILTIMVLFLLSFNVKIYSADQQNSVNSAEQDSLERFQSIIYLIKNYYVEDVDLNKLLDGAINGMVEELDPHSIYLTPDEYEEMQLEFDGHFGGIGIVVTERDKQITIVAPIKGTPGDKVGLKSEDVITAINGKSTENMKLDDAVDIMRGEEGTGINLDISRKGNEEPLHFEITRADIKIPYVESEMKKNNIGYIQIAQFAQNVGDKVKKALIELKARGAQGLILDLRNNPGGMLTEAVKVASNFIDNKKIVSIKGRVGKEKVLKADDSIKATQLPLVILINGGSASASEIVTGAVKDYSRGTIIGSKSFGKGTVQTLIPLNNGSALKLTTARYYTPSGNFIHKKGIKPDINVEYDSEYDGDNQLDKALEYLSSTISDQNSKLKSVAN